jgi:hypothetical protein
LNPQEGCIIQKTRPRAASIYIYFERDGGRDGIDITRSPLFTNNHAGFYSSILTISSISETYKKVKVKVKVFRYKPDVVLGVPGD